MGYQTGIRDALGDWGLDVTLVPGWATRGSSSFDPHGHVVHHDVIPNSTSVPSLIVYGRSDLAGPLCNFWLRYDGRVFLVAAGRANHAGEGSWNGLVGNSSVWGTEMNNLGTAATPWPERQLDAMVKLAAATADFSGFAPANVCGHKEWTSRKVDPHSINMGAFRLRVSDADKKDFTIMDRETREYFDAKFAHLNEVVATRKGLRLANERIKLILEKLRG